MNCDTLFGVSLALSILFVSSFNSCVLVPYGTRREGSWLLSWYVGPPSPPTVPTLYIQYRERGARCLVRPCAMRHDSTCGAACPSHENTAPSPTPVSVTPDVLTMLATTVPWAVVRIFPTINHTANQPQSQTHGHPPHPTVPRLCPARSPTHHPPCPDALRRPMLMRTSAAKVCSKCCQQKSAAANIVCKCCQQKCAASVVSTCCPHVLSADVVVFAISPHRRDVDAADHIPLCGCLTTTCGEMRRDVA